MKAPHNMMKSYSVGVPDSPRNIWHRIDIHSDGFDKVMLTIQSEKRSRFVVKLATPGGGTRHACPSKIRDGIHVLAWPADYSRLAFFKLVSGSDVSVHYMLTSIDMRREER